ncbi:nucleoside phosphorylase [Halomarina halobia]|uniref:Nucleoside phosphorylase n=1 Tax=Halomarina halobia TaxID=3033386 RepID=A0ABD6A5K6_9EURY|nr:nucleoside phosphorylase [Halomarina sp. PSR21]
MGVPLLPEKYDSDPVLAPRGASEYADDRGSGARSLPAAMVVCYAPVVLESVAERYDGTEVADYRAGGSCYRLEATGGRVGIVGGFGVGAPATALLLEGLFASGVETVLLAGYAGCLADEVGPEDVIVPPSALRDEGTSYHYRPPERYAPADAALVEHVREHLDAADVDYRVGPTWTTDAPYRETVAEVEAYAAEGVLTVEMEAAAAFAVAAHRERATAALFTPSDYLVGTERDPSTHDLDEALRRLGRLAVDAIEAY